MKATELRIGNYLLDDKGRLCKVESIQVRDPDEPAFSAPGLIGSITYLPHRGLPLCEQVFLRMDFVRKERCWWNGSIVINVMPDQAFREHWSSRKLEFAHELQNLNYALTGKELTLKDTW